MPSLEQEPGAALGLVDVAAGADGNEICALGLAAPRLHHLKQRRRIALRGSPRASPQTRSYFVTIRRVGATVLVGAIGESENVSQVFQPDGRLAASNSPYPFRFR